MPTVNVHEFEKSIKHKDKYKVNSLQSSIQEVQLSALCWVI